MTGEENNETAKGDFDVNAETDTDADDLTKVGNLIADSKEFVENNFEYSANMDDEQKVKLYKESYEIETAKRKEGKSMDKVYFKNIN